MMLLLDFASLGQRGDTLVQLVVLYDLILWGIWSHSITLLLGIRVLGQDVIMIRSEHT
jgi:hypothetical protein